ncbi:MAG: PEP/pyruvate-binding domain-containing protein [Actinomycetota bacterium]
MRLTEASDPSLAGAKAAALARAHQSGLPVLPGFVLTPDTATAVAAASPAAAATAVRQAWAELSDHGSRSLVVRSSSTVEDGAESSMAGRFESLLDVRGFDSFVDAVRAVVASGEAVHDGRLPGDSAVAGRMAVLVQPFITPAAGGVMFGADPVTGRHDRYVIAAVSGGPDQLVSGEVDGVTVTLSTRGRIVDTTGSIPALDTNIRGLVALQKRASTVFGGAQDIEWAIHEGDVVLLQSRPITATGTDTDATGPLFGPGPVAETFPSALTPLELDLWVDPMTDAIREVLTITGAAPARKLAASPVIVNVRGHVAADLVLLGVEKPAGRARSLWAKIDPRPPARRLKVAWQVGRLRAALPGLARDQVEDIDAQLGDVPPISELSDRELVGLLEGARQALKSLYGYEMLAGQLLDADGAPVTAASAALRVLAAERDSELSDEELVARHPVLLALFPPTIGGTIELPPVPGSMPTAPDVDEQQLLREALRLRSRWVQELMARAAVALGRRLHEAGRLSDATLITALPFADVRALVRGEIAFADPTPVVLDGAPLPAKFRLTPEGAVVAVRLEIGAHRDGGRGAGGGRGRGVVLPADSLPAEGAVLVVRTLDPALAAMLPGLRGLVSETGSVLSHLAILAREFGVPTVVGVEDAVARFAPGTEVVVDGSTGEVSALTSEEVAA